MIDAVTRMRTIATRHPLVEAGPGGELPALPKSAWIEVDLDAIAANARLFAELIGPGASVQPVVKADAYGHGAVAVSRALVASGIESLVVATFDEGLELRQAGIEVPILILFPIPPELAPAALRHRLSITVGDVELTRRTLAALDQAVAGAALGAPDTAGADSRLSIHLEIETGLGRGGAFPEEIVSLVRLVSQSPMARIAGMWGHLQEAGNAKITTSQAAHFDRAAGFLEDATVSVPLRHLSASGGILAGTVDAYDMVRIGISIYGIVPDGLEPSDANRAIAARLVPALSLRARPVRVATLPTDWGVSYGPTFRTKRESRIATIPIGYADGWPRSLSNKAQVLVRGRRVPQVGTIAMDALMIDVTDVPGPAVTIDDEFTLVGRQGGDEIGAQEVARWGNTISYEVLSAMSGRLPRVYYADSKPVAMRSVALETP